MVYAEAKIKVKWGEIPEADLYEVYIKYCGTTFTKNNIHIVKGGKNTSVIIDKINDKVLNSTKNYNIYLKAYKYENGKKVRIRAKTKLEFPKRKQLSDKHAKEFRYATTNKDIATVSTSGIITAKKAGTCYVYVYARNGYAKKIKVDVK